MAELARFGKYVLTGRLAEGGMAEVFRAKLVGEAGFERAVALKRILPEYSGDDAFIRMFIDEARIAGKLHHGNIVQTLELGRLQGSYYIAMELVEGLDVAAFIDGSLERGLAPQVPLACFVAAEVCRGLAYAHDAKDETGAPLGIIHRDISPQNILLSVHGEVKISDFGIARARDRSVGPTMVGTVKGKGGYMAPEQCESGSALDRRADIHAVGAVLYELLTFRPLHDLPLTGDLAQRLRRLPPPRVSAVNPSCGATLEALVQRCVAADPAARFPDARSLETALMRYLHGEAGGFSSRDLADYLQEHFPDLADAHQEAQRKEQAGFRAVPHQPMEVLFAQGTPPGATSVQRRPRKAPSAPPARLPAPAAAPALDEQPTQSADVRGLRAHLQGSGDTEQIPTQVLRPGDLARGPVEGSGATEVMTLPTEQSWRPELSDPDDELEEEGTFASRRAVTDRDLAGPPRSVRSAAADLWGDEEPEPLPEPPVTQPLASPAVPEQLEDDSWTYGEDIPLDLQEEPEGEDIPMDSMAEIRLDPLVSAPDPTPATVVDARALARPARPRPVPPPVAPKAAAALRSHRVGNADGKLLVAAPADAQVRVDGVDAGAGRVLLEGLDRRGHYRVQVMAPGFQPWGSAVTLGGKATGVVRVNLVPRRGG